MSSQPNHAAQAMRKLSPRRKTTRAETAGELAAEQLLHFGIDPNSEYGRTLGRIAERLYESGADAQQLWRITVESIGGLDRSDRIAYFNAKKFLSFQLAKILDTVQQAFRHSYQAQQYSDATQTAKGPYPTFDNVLAIFSATPVIARTATYIYACAEWIEDAFQGKEMILEIYSRLLNPTSVSLANYIVDLEGGPYAADYFAWNFNSGMAAIDTTLAHLLGRDDILITSRHLYGGVHQLVHDWYAKPSNLDIAVETFRGVEAEDFSHTLEAAQEKYRDRLAAGRKIYTLLESPCNPHGYVLDVPTICRAAHTAGVRVILDGTIATPFLTKPLQRDDPAERPDFLIHSYTKDLTGTGSAIAGVVIGRNEDMFVPKGETSGGVAWNETMFWNVYYVKGAFLNADAAFEVIQGIRTLTVRMLAKCINTKIMAAFLDSHPQIRVSCNCLPGNENARLREQLLRYGLPAPLFTVDLESVPADAFLRFFDSLAPTFGHMISLGQSNTIVSCPALTTHSELDAEALRETDLGPRTIRIAIGDEDPTDLIFHFVNSARLTLDPAVPGFSEGFMAAQEADQMIGDCYLEAHRKFAAAMPRLAHRKSLSD